MKYDNYKMLNQDGTFMCYINEKRFNWYLKKKLAYQIDSHTIKITFKPEGRGALDRCSPFYLEEIDNHCVVCGCENNLSRHHILPTRYRKHLPETIKGSNHFDIIIICRTHHDEYEVHAREFDKKIFEKYNYDYELINNKRYPRIISVMKGLLKNYDLIPYKNRIQYINEFEDFLGKKIQEINISQEIEKYENNLNEEFLYLLKDIGDVDDFTIEWRKHFMQYAKPKYIKKSWINDIEKRFYNYNWKVYYEQH